MLPESTNAPLTAAGIQLPVRAGHDGEILDAAGECHIVVDPNRELADHKVALIASTIVECLNASSVGSVRKADRDAIRAEIINTPETADFMAGVPIEVAHQRDRWPSEHDAGKSPFDWFWLVGYLAQKAAAAAVAGDVDKAQHHTISTAAALANWHAALTGADTSIRPGIEPPEPVAALHLVGGEPA